MRIEFERLLECFYFFFALPRSFFYIIFSRKMLLLFKSTLKNLKFYCKHLREKESIQYFKFHIYRVEMPNENIFEFTAVVRGFHYCKRFWVPKPSQKLNWFYEPDKPFDEFAIKVCEEGHEVPAGHLWRKIYRATNFFIDRGANITLTLTSHHYRRSPLVQGGMVIACEVTASIPGTCINFLLVDIYKNLVEDTYTDLIKWRDLRLSSYPAWRGWKSRPEGDRSKKKGENSEKGRSENKRHSSIFCSCVPH